MGQKVAIRLWWESGLPSPSGNRLTAFAALTSTTHV